MVDRRVDVDDRPDDVVVQWVETEYETHVARLGVMVATVFPWGTWHVYTVDGVVVAGGRTEPDPLTDDGPPSIAELKVRAERALRASQWARND